MMMMMMMMMMISHQVFLHIEYMYNDNNCKLMSKGGSLMTGAVVWGV